MSEKEEQLEYLPPPLKMNSIRIGFHDLNLSIQPSIRLIPIKGKEMRLCRNGH